MLALFAIGHEGPDIGYIVDVILARITLQSDGTSSTK